MLNANIVIIALVAIIQRRQIIARLSVGHNLFATLHRVQHALHDLGQHRCHLGVDHFRQSGQQVVDAAAQLWFAGRLEHLQRKSHCVVGQWSEVLLADGARKRRKCVDGLRTQSDNVFVVGDHQEGLQPLDDLLKVGQHVFLGCRRGRGDGGQGELTEVHRVAGAECLEETLHQERQMRHNGVFEILAVCFEGVEHAINVFGLFAAAADLGAQLVQELEEDGQHLVGVLGDVGLQVLGELAEGEQRGVANDRIGIDDAHLDGVQHVLEVFGADGLAAAFGDDGHTEIGSLFGVRIVSLERWLNESEQRRQQLLWRHMQRQQVHRLRGSGLWTRLVRAHKVLLVVLILLFIVHSG